MLHIVNAQNLIDAESETLYSFREGIPIGEYPQVHDFFEFTLVTSGSFITTIEGKTTTVSKGDLITLFPGVTHAKEVIPGITSSHINLAMLPTTINDLFQYLYSKKPEEVLDKNLPIIQLANNQLNFIQSEMDYLSLFPLTEKSEKRSHLRKLLVYLVSDIIVPSLRNTRGKMIIPYWMQSIMKEMNNPDNLYEGLTFMVTNSGKTKEHICREFKKHLGISPVSFINTRKLNYAANMLKYSNRDISEICNNLGFCSLSYFYKLFKKSFGFTPREYRLQFRKIEDNQLIPYV